MKPHRALALAAALALPSALAAQPRAQRVSLSFTEAVRAVAVEPGGEIVLRGAARSSHDGAVVDALTTRPGATGVEGDGEPVPGGLYDVEAGGWRLVSRDLRGHAYRLAATGNPGEACVAAGVASPCLSLRLLPLAQSRLLAVADFARTLSGEVTLEVLDPDATPAALPPFAARSGAPLALGGLALAGALAAARALRKRSAAPEVRLRRTAAKVRAKLAAGDPVHRALVPSIEALVAHADALAVLRDRLRAMVAAAHIDELSARRDELAAQEAAGVVEAARARGFVDEQIARVTTRSREAERASARIAEVHEYLKALLQRLDDAMGTVASARDASTREALAALEADLQAALDGAREADAAARGR